MLTFAPLAASLIASSSRSTAPANFSTSTSLLEEITISEIGASPENLSSTKDGTVYFGSTSKGTIYRALPNQSKAESWIKGSEAGLSNVLGVFADEKSNTLWVCTNMPFGRNATSQPSGQTSLRSFNLKTGAPKGNYPTPGGGLFNDIAISKDGTVYISDTTDARILRLKPGSQSLEVWVSDAQLKGIDGITFLADGALYFNNYFNGNLSRIRLAADGTAGPIMNLETSLKFTRPDGLRTTGGMSMYQVEGTGRLTQITINGDKANATVLGEGFTQATGVTPRSKDILVLIERTKAVVVKSPSAQ